MVSSVSSANNYNYQIPDIPPLYCPTGFGEDGNLEFAYQGNDNSRNTMLQSNTPCITGSGCNCNSALSADSFTPSNMGPSISSYTSENAMSAVYPTDASNDGEFSFWEAGKNFVGGFFSPLKQLLTTPEGLATLAVGTGLAIATGGLILPVYAAIGAGLTAYSALNGIGKVLTAKNGDDIEKACGNFGEAAFGAATLGFGSEFAAAKAGKSVTSLFGSNKLGALWSYINPSSLLGSLKASKNALSDVNVVKSNFGSAWKAASSSLEGIKNWATGSNKVANAQSWISGHYNDAKSRITNPSDKEMETMIDAYYAKPGENIMSRNDIQTFLGKNLANAGYKKPITATATHNAEGMPTLLYDPTAAFLAE